MKTEIKPIYTPMNYEQLDSELSELFSFAVQTRDHAKELIDAIQRLKMKLQKLEVERLESKAEGV